MRAYLQNIIKQTLYHISSVKWEMSLFFAFCIDSNLLELGTRIGVRGIKILF